MFVCNGFRGLQGDHVTVESLSFDSICFLTDEKMDILHVFESENMAIRRGCFDCILNHPYIPSERFGM